MTEHKIKLKLDSPYRVKVESLEEFSTSLFFETYKKAAKIIKEICLEKQEMRQKMKKNKGADRSGMLEENIYTVVPFLGNRGTGKTSTMVSFALSFLQNYSCMEKDFEEERGIYKELGVENLNAKFNVLDMIDATILETPAEIIEIVLVRMLDQLREMEERRTAAGRRYREDFEKSKRYLMQDFEETIEAIQNLFYKKDFNNKMDICTPMDYLKGMGISWNLKTQIRKLISNYIKVLSCLNYTEEMDNYLVIMIDDIDMNVKNCYEFLEIIRCYFMLPDVIVLLSTNYEQLHQMCKNYYQKMLLGDYETRRINGLANEYLEKVIPTGRKLFLPAIRSEEETRSIGISGTNGSELLTIREEILGSIYKYTGLLYCPNGEERHFMEPKTIRKLTNYKKELSLLMPINEENKRFDLLPNDKILLLSNLDWMYNDVMNRLAVLKLDGEYLFLFREIVQQSSANRNSIIIRKLLEYFDPKKEDKKFLAYLEENTNLSYGDVLYVLEKCKNWQTEEKKLVECIIAFYMVSIYKQLVLEDFGIKGTTERKMEMQTVFASISGANSMGYLTNYLLPDLLFQNSKNLEQGGEQQETEAVKQKSITFTVRKENVNIKNTLDGILSKEEKENNSLHNFEIVNMFSLFRTDEVGENVTIDLLNFIPYIFEYQLYMPQVLSYIAKKTDKTESELKEKSLLSGMDRWKKKYKTTAIIPFYSMDFMFHLSKVVHERMQKYAGKTVSENGIRSIFIEFFRIIGEELKKLDLFYEEYEKKSGAKQESVSYFVVYRENPFIEMLGIFEQPLSKEQIHLWEVIIFMFANQELTREIKSTSDDSMQDD